MQSNRPSPARGEGSGSRGVVTIPLQFGPGAGVKMSQHGRGKRKTIGRRHYGTHFVGCDRLWYQPRRRIDMTRFLPSVSAFVLALLLTAVAIAPLPAADPPKDAQPAGKNIDVVICLDCS